MGWRNDDNEPETLDELSDDELLAAVAGIDELPGDIFPWTWKQLARVELVDWIKVNRPHLLEERPELAKGIE